MFDEPASDSGYRAGREIYSAITVGVCERNWGCERNSAKKCQRTALLKLHKYQKNDVRLCGTCCRWAGFYPDGIHWSKQAATLQLQMFLIDIFKMLHFWALFHKRKRKNHKRFDKLHLAPTFLVHDSSSILLEGLTVYSSHVDLVTGRNHLSRTRHMWIRHINRKMKEHTRHSSYVTSLLVH